MSKLGKRVLAVFLSVLMVVTMLPTISLTAFASTDESFGLAGEYLTDSSFSGVTNNGVTWDEDMNAAYFNGSSYIKLNDIPFKKASVSTGFAISFDVYNPNMDNTNYYFYFSDKGSNAMTMNGSDPTWYIKYRTQFLSSSGTRAYYTSDFNSSFCDYWVATNGDNGYMNDMVGANHWYNLTVVMDTNGAYSYYIDGVLKGRFYSNYDTKTTYSDGVTDDTITSIVQSFTDYYIGSDDSGNNAFTGYIKNVRLYDKAPDSKLVGITSAMNQYERMMNGTVYTNMTAAYDAYVAAQKAYDQYYYGGDATIDISSYTDKLNTAINNMSVWSYSEFATVVPTYQGTSTSEKMSEYKGTYIRNIVYADTFATTPVLSLTKNSKAVEVGLEYPANSVLLYDGQYRPALPVLCYTKKSGSSTRYVYTVYPTSTTSTTTPVADNTEIQLLAKFYNSSSYDWKGGDGVNSSDWAYGMTNGKQYIGSDSANSNNRSSNSVSSNNSQHYSSSLTVTDDIDFGNAHYKKFNLTWQYYASSDTSTPQRTDDYYANGTSTNNIYVVDYKSLLDSIDKYKSRLNINVSNYREDKLKSLLSVFDEATSLTPSTYFTDTTDIEKDVENLSNKITSLITDLSQSITADDGNYQTLRNAMDYRGTVSGLVVDGENDGFYSVRELYNAGNDSNTYDATLYATFKKAYEEAQSVMKTNLYSDSANASTKATALLNAFNALEYSKVTLVKPTFSRADGVYLTKNDEVTITNGDESGTVTYYIDGESKGTIGAGKSATIKPFESASGTAQVTIKAVVDNNGAQDYDEVTYHFIDTPSFSRADGDLLAEGDEVTITTADAEAKGQIYYSFDGTSYSEYTSPIVPFDSDSTNLVKTIYAYEQVTGSDNVVAKTAPVKITVYKTDEFIISATNSDGSTSEDYFTGDSTIYIKNTKGKEFTDTIYYILTVDNVQKDMAEYNADTGISCKSYGDNASISVIAFVAKSELSQYQVAQATFLNKNQYEELLYHESFDGATISGNTLTTGSEKGLNATLLNSGSASIVEGAGDTHGNANGANYSYDDGNSADWRENVLKINANSTLPGNIITVASNPLSTDIAKAAALKKGVTISFWRHFETTDGGRVDSLGTKDGTNDNWRNGITFMQGTVGTTTDKYYMIELDGINSFVSKGATDYVDYVPKNQDATGHATGNDSGYWVNIVVTVDPNKGITVYANGDPHESTLSKNGIYNVDNDAYYAQELLKFLCDSDTLFTINNGNNWDGNENDLYLDDIRIYDKTLTQVDIYNMYAGDDADVTTSSLNSHDPTNVTVYTLDNGKQVGQEYIDYNNIDITTDEVASIDYYSFGTGMTIYHSTDNVNWEAIGDKFGNFGYQNLDLFGAGEEDGIPYTTALAEPENFVTSVTNASGAGKLVWAPHVMYNLELDTWVYYGACSVWGDTKSAMFMAVSVDGTPLHFKYNSLVKTSTTRPNAIDACVFYGHNSDGSINKDELYLTHGAWSSGANASEDIYITQLNADGTSQDTSNTAGTSLAASIDQTGEGSYVIYRNGFYYLYISYGHNDGNYQERVYRSTTPTGQYSDYKGTLSTDTTTSDSSNGTRGNKIIGAFSSRFYDYVYVSTGHNSVYTAINNNGEVVTLHATHARPYTNSFHYWTALPDGALASRQSDLTGNVTLINQVAYTSTGWPLLMPAQYNGTDTLDISDLKAEDLNGVYSSIDFGSDFSYDINTAYTFTMASTGDYTGVAYGTRSNGANFRLEYTITYSESAKQNFITMEGYTSDGENVTLLGAVATHTDDDGTVVPEIAWINNSTMQQAWAFRYSETPEADQESAGNMVATSGVIYTHKTDNHYSMYGQEISDNFSYGTTGTSSSSGERYTTITTTYPYAIDVNSATSVYCLSDEDLVESGYTGGTYTVVDNDGVWKDQSGKTYTDSQALAYYNGLTDAQKEDDSYSLTKTYGLTGYVSNYFHYHTGDDCSVEKSSGVTNSDLDVGYPSTGVELIVQYSNKVTGDSYGEYQFLYVTPNPTWAHEIIAVRNQHSDNGEKRTANAVFSRFIGSVGSATDIVSSVTAGMNVDITSTSVSSNRSTGNFKYLASWGSDESLAEKNYTKPADIASQFNSYDKTAGSRAGSYACLEHKDTAQYSYGISPAVVNANYYIDYSNTADYGSLITTSNGKPTGYTFQLLNSNLYWTDYADVEQVTSFVKNTTSGLTATYSTNCGKTTSTLARHLDIDFENYPNEDTAHGSKAYEMMLTNGSLTPAFSQMYEGSYASNTWTGTVTFTGKDSVKASTDTTSAETYANYILELGIFNKYTWNLTKTGHIAEETYQYYNIGVNTCDKGAVREFVETFCNKQMTLITDDDGRILGMTAGDDIESGNYSVESYREYLDAIAEAYYFIENPYNTTYTDSNGVEQEYTTAYATVDGAEHALIYTDEEGSDIFGTGTTNTDPIQAQIIQNIIDAYDNLFDKTKYEEAKEVYEAKVEALSDEGITSASYDAYNQFLEDVKSSFSYELDLDDCETTDEYWRYSNLSGSQYEELQEAIEKMESSLMPVVDTAELSQSIDTQEDVLKDGIFNSSGEQQYSYGSWLAIKQEVDTAESCVDTAEKEQAGKYAVTGQSEFKFNGKTYTYDTFVESDDNLSTEQTTVNDENTTLLSKELKGIDDSDSYEAFDDAKIVTEGINFDKYSDGGAALKEKIAQLSAKVYITLSSDEIKAYNSYDTTGDVSQKIKVTSITETDPITAELLEYVNTINDISSDDCLVKKFTAKFVTQYTDNYKESTTSTQTAYYGDMFAFDVGTLDDDEYVTWSVTTYDYGTDFSGTANGSNKATGYESIQRVADANISVTANISKGDNTTGSTKVIVKNLFGKVVQVLYVDDTAIADATQQTTTVGGQTITAEDIPFYTFTGWTSSTSDGVVTIKPNYSVNASYTITVVDGTVTAPKSVGDGNSIKTRFDNWATISYNGSGEFVAWAVHNDDDTYQVASYNPSYSFYVVADEDYVPITVTNDVYYIDGEELTASMLDSQIDFDASGISENNSFANKDKLVKAKLKAKAPFISIEATDIIDGKSKAYVRITDGSTYTSCKVHADNGSVQANFAITNIGSNGQFVSTIKSGTPVTYTAIINYDLDYTFGGTNTDDNATSTNISLVDNSSSKTASARS
jgi:hypothetical protein